MPKVSFPGTEYRSVLSPDYYSLNKNDPNRIAEPVRRVLPPWPTIASPAGSREHIGSKWVLERQDFGPFCLKRAGAAEVILNKIGFTTKSVCEKCNNGCMSELEKKVKPILEPMFDGKPVTIDAEQQHLIAVWVAKIAFLWDSTKGRNANKSFYRLSDGNAIATQYQIPNFTAVWIGYIDEKHRSVDGADFTLDDPRTASVEDHRSHSPMSISWLRS
jgi:hypothetical protein